MAEKFAMGAGSAGTSVAGLIRFLKEISAECQDRDGKFIAQVLSPEQAELAYAEAFRDFEEHREEILAAGARNGGVTTAEMLKKCRRLEV